MSEESSEQVWKSLPPELALDEFNQTLLDEKIAEIKIPAHQSDRIRVSESGWQITSTTILDPVTPYLWNSEDLGEMVNLSGDRNAATDYMIAGHNGHGIASFGFGIVAQIGSLTIAQQHHYGGAFGDVEKDRANLNEQIRIWNNNLWAIENVGRFKSVPLLIEFSTFRNLAQISEWDANFNEWKLVLDPLRSRMHASLMLSSGQTQDPHVQVAGSYLNSLLQAKPRMWHEANKEVLLYAGSANENSEEIEYLFLGTRTSSLMRKDGIWVEVPEEVDEATEGCLMFQVHSGFISFFDDAQELGIRLPMTAANDYDMDLVEDFDKS